MCETCIHESVCMFRGDFIELYTKASNDVYGNIFNVTCNEYREKEEFKEHIGLENKSKDRVEYDLICDDTVYTYEEYKDILSKKYELLNANKHFKMYKKVIDSRGNAIVGEIN